MKDIVAEKSIVLFDGTCGFCKSCVDFAFRHSVKDNFLFYPLQSDPGIALLKNFGFPENYSGSVLLVENGKFFLKSTAILRVLKKLKWTARWMYLFIIVPRFVRDKVYDWVARNRSKLSANEQCTVPEKKK